MIRISKYMILSAMAVASLASCDDYLDKLPDDRTEIDNEEKVAQILVSAYPTNTNILVLEMSSDNVADNGTTYTNSSNLCDELYRFKDVDVTTSSNDSPYYVWNACYDAVNTANTALEAIAALGDPSSLAPYKAEAKLCRAYAMFQLANVFCMAYNPDNADTYPGLPYPEATGSNLTERGTLAELYAKINQDIEDALPDVTDNYTTPKYHFNTKAAYAFATRFNVYYMNYDKAITYATKVLGTNPASVLRDYTSWINQGSDDKMNTYISSSEQANLLLVTSYSMAGIYPGLYEGNYRFQHNTSICNYETCWAAMPWGSGSRTYGNTLYNSNVYGQSYFVYVPKIDCLFEYTDKVNRIGYYHIVEPVFTTDETLLYRAEAYALKGEYQSSVDDMNAWIVGHCSESNGENVRPTLTIDDINDLWNGIDYTPDTLESNSQRTPKKKLEPQGFTVNSGTQENLIHMVLHMRRIEMLGQGTRFLDIKRYGIAYHHYITNEDSESLQFKAGDLRGAIQIPADVVQAGLAANPR